MIPRHTPDKFTILKTIGFQEEMLYAVEKYRFQISSETDVLTITPYAFKKSEDVFTKR